LDGELCAFPPRTHANHDPRSARGVHERVRKQCPPDLEDSLLVAEAPDVLLDVRVQEMTGPGAHGLELRGEGPRDLHGVHWLAGNPELARIHTRQVEEIG